MNVAAIIIVSKKRSLNMLMANYAVQTMIVNLAGALLLHAADQEKSAAKKTGTATPSMA